MQGWGLMDDEPPAARPDEPPNQYPDIAEITRRSRAAMGLPNFIEDENALDSFTAMVAQALARKDQGKAPKQSQETGTEPEPT